MIDPTHIGCEAYKRSYGIKFIHEATALAQPYERNIRVLPNRERWSLRMDLKGASVAVVGNGKVQDAGQLIDAYDVVIRISTMRSWGRKLHDDGERLDIWAGHPAFVVDWEGDHPVAQEKFADAIAAGADLWCLSPFHVSLESFIFMNDAGVWSNLAVLPPPYALYEDMSSCLPGADLKQLFSIAEQNDYLVGFPVFDLLLTGTRLLVLLEHIGVRSLGVFGMNLFSSEPEALWFGHDMRVDFDVIGRVKSRFLLDGRKFYWHEEQATLYARNNSERALRPPPPSLGARLLARLRR